MAKNLSEMSLAELWELFPIYLTEHQDCWSDWYEEELNDLKTLLPVESGLRISHIGSTAVRGIWAKPIIDILIEVPDSVTLKAIKQQMTADGYLCMSDKESRISLNKGYTAKGFAERVFHIHLRLINDNDEIYFKEYLNINPEIAKKYEKLKLALWNKYEHDRDKYTTGKTEFVMKYTKLAKEFFTEAHEPL